MDEPYKIPGLGWDGLSIQQSKTQQNFVSQELARYKTKPMYLARLQHLQIKPVPTPAEINTYDPCADGKMIKMEWNKNDMTQEKVPEISFT